MHPDHIVANFLFGIAIGGFAIHYGAALITWVASRKRRTNGRDGAAPRTNLAGTVDED